MARFVYSTACSLDGFIADADHSLQWLFDVPQEPHDTVFADFLAEVAVLVMGATTYRWVLESEQVLTHPDKWHDWYGDRPTWVFTHQDLPSVPDARIEFVSGPVSDHLARLASAAGDRAVWLVGGGELVGAFDDHHALDEIRLGIVPVVLGSGAQVLPRRITSRRLTLRASTRVGQRVDTVYDVGR